MATGRERVAVGDQAALVSLARRAPIGLAVLDADDRLVAANDAFVTLLGATDGAPDWEQLPAGFDTVAGSLVGARAGTSQRLVCEAGSRTLRMRFDRAHGSAGDDGHVEVSVEDVSAAVRVADDLSRSASQFRAAFDTAPIGMALVGLDGRLRRVNGRMADIVGSVHDTLSGRMLTDLVATDDVADVERHVERAVRDGRAQGLEAQVLTVGTAPVWIELSLAAVTDGDGRTRHLVAQVADITERKAAQEALLARQEELSFRATHDELTGLPNRRLLAEHLDLALRRLQRSAGQLAVLFFDLDEFKPVNDEHGHEAGDIVLVAVAERLRRACRDSDIVARYGGDEFVMVCDGLHAEPETLLVAARVLRALQEPISLPDAEVTVGVSIGIAMATLGDTVSSVVARADEAVYEAKAGRGNPVIATGAARTAVD